MPFEIFPPTERDSDERGEKEGKGFTAKTHPCRFSASPGSYTLKHQLRPNATKKDQKCKNKGNSWKKRNIKMIDRLPKINDLHMLKPDQLALNRNPQIGLCACPQSLTELKQGLVPSNTPPSNTPTALSQQNPPVPFNPG